MGVDVVDITAKRAALTPHRIAFEDAISGRKLSYSELDDRAARCAGAFAALGVAREDRVALLCRNRIEFFEVMFACAKLGAILVPLNWRAPPAELAPLLEDCAPKILLYGREDAGCAQALARTGLMLVALDAGEGGPYYERLLADADPLRCDARWRGEAIWSLLYTSGTTGSPKAVIQTHQMAMVNAFHVCQAFGVNSADTTLNFLPLFHTAGIQLVTMPTLIAGGTVIVLPGFDAERSLSLLQTRLDVFFAVPAVYQQLALHPQFAQSDLSRVRAWGCGGAPLPDVLVERFAEKGARVCNGYGMTETGPTAFVAAPEDALQKIGSVGRPQMLLEARIVANGRDAAEGECGEIWMRGAGLTPGYWRRPEETANAFTADGWLKSGDVGRRDADGCYYVVGRIKEMYISGGENVYPAEVENVLARHPAVLEAAVVGVPDAQWGEVGHAFVMLRSGASAPSAEELVGFCRANLAAFKAPRHVTFVAEFPRTPAGKIRKHLLEPVAKKPAARALHA